MTRKTTVRPRSHDRRRFGSNTDDAYVFTVVTDERDGADAMSYSVHLDPVERRWTTVRRGLAREDGEFTETTTHCSSSSVTDTPQEAPLREDELESLVEAWYHHDQPSADPDGPPADASDRGDGGSPDSHPTLFDAGPGWQR